MSAIYNHLVSETPQPCRSKFINKLHNGQTCFFQEILYNLVTPEENVFQAADGQTDRDVESQGLHWTD